MGSRSKGPHRFTTTAHGDTIRRTTYPYKSARHRGPESKLARRVRRKHTRGRNFHRLLGYKYAQKYRQIGSLTGRREHGPRSRAKRLR